MLRLSLYTGDTLLQDIAHNAVIGRYSSYPGYYYKGFAVSQLEPEFPLEVQRGYIYLLSPYTGTTRANDGLFDQRTIVEIEW